MFKFLLICAFVALAAAVEDDTHAEVKSFHADVNEHGFDYALDTTNNIHAASSGDEKGNVHGDFEWVSPEGQHVKVTYVADENGYQPTSDLLPTPPPVPAAIVKALAYLASHPSKEDSYKH